MALLPITELSDPVMFMLRCNMHVALCVLFAAAIMAAASWLSSLSDLATADRI